VTIAAAVAAYRAHLSASGRVSYPLRQQLHRAIAAHLGEVEHCRAVHHINSEFDRAEREAGANQQTWHGVR
jgi:hypothetical protein